MPQDEGPDGDGQSNPSAAGHKRVAAIGAPGHL